MIIIMKIIKDINDIDITNIKLGDQFLLFKSKTKIINNQEFNYNNVESLILNSCKMNCLSFIISKLFYTLENN